MTRPVLAAHEWKSNATLMLALRQLGYLDDDLSTLDVTFGRGAWWKLWQPARFAFHDLKIDGVDFRSLPEPDASVDVVAYDAPYVPIGSQETSTLKDYNSRYGRDTAPRTPEGLQELIDDGLAEVRRVLAPPRRGPDGRLRGGTALVKCADYIWSGRLELGTDRTLRAALALGFTVEERLIHVGKAPRPQPGGRSRRCPACKGSPAGCELCAAGRIATRQEHARTNWSQLLVLRRSARLDQPRLL